MTILDEKAKAWLAIRKEAAKAIDPATAEVTWIYGDITDPYGVRPDGGDQCIGRIYFMRAPGSIWVEEGDLPKRVFDAIWKRINRQELKFVEPPSAPDLPDVNRLVVQVMARNDAEPGYAAAVAGRIAARLEGGSPEMQESSNAPRNRPPRIRT